jgi:tRNA nucleotidyltransferase/poly(A) polymerase
VVARLRAAGHETYWAGGCVRDELLGRTPADYDVATAALPEVVRQVFGRKRTLAIGAAFGVITVLGPKGAGQVEVATFRTDAAYTDGRHPAGVSFCSAREDAKRRDFTINGLFLDPLSGEVHDFVGGRADLAAGIVRAIGVPAQRFGEDHLRMLRAIRFTAFFDFVLDGETRAAIERMAHLVAAVSPERIAAELRAMVERTGRQRALLLLAETGLAREVLPELAPADGDGSDHWAIGAAVVAALDEPSLPQAVAVLASDLDAAAATRIARQLRLSNHETKAIAWLHAAVGELGKATHLASRPWSAMQPWVAELRKDTHLASRPWSQVQPWVAELGKATHLASRPWSQVQPWVADPRAPLLADLLRARAAHGLGDAAAAAWFTAQATRPRAEIDPLPLVTGSDLLAAGVPAGPAMGAALAKARQLQLDGLVTTPEEALAAVRPAP